MRQLTSALVAVPVAWLALASVADAAPYEAFIDIESPEDLDDLLATGQIDSETHAALYELLARGVDLDRATREELYSLPNLTYDEVDAILGYRETQGFIANPADLVAAGAVTEQKLLAIAAFLVQVDRRRGEYAPRGDVVVRTRASQGDHDLPPILLRARVSFGKDLSAGFAATLTRLRVGAVSWDPNNHALLADRPGLRPHLPKVFVRRRTDKLDVIAGTYRIGFAERLTFDNSADYTPNGIYADNQISSSDSELSRECKESIGGLAASPCTGVYEYVTPDFHWSDGLLGVAAGSDHLPLSGDSYLQAYAWGSYQPRSIYQYELVDRLACPDPRDQTDPACKAPTVLVRPEADDPFTPAAAAAYQTLPDLYAETLVNDHLTVHTARHDFVGVTAYGATTRWLIDQPDDVRLDAQEWSRLPIGGRYGAIGASAGLGRGIYDGFAEVTRSFDRIPDGPGAIDGGGGIGAIVRGTRSVRKREVEVSLRYYDPDFVNPYAGSIAASDEVEGQRVRGEQGVRVKYAGLHGNLNLRLSIDALRSYIVDTDSWAPRLTTYAHVDLQASDQLTYGVWIDFADKDLGAGGYGACYETEIDEGLTDAPDFCRGMRLKTLGRLRYKVDRSLTFTASLQHSWVDDPRYDDKRRNDVAGTLIALWRPSPKLRVRGRVKYLSEDISDGEYLEESVWTYAEVVSRVRARDTLTLRGDLFVFLDDRDSSARRSPQPELRVLASYQARF